MVGGRMLRAAQKWAQAFILRAITRRAVHSQELRFRRLSTKPFVITLSQMLPRSVILKITCLGLLSATAIFGAFHVFWTHRSRSGPVSPSGYQVAVLVSDAGWSWSADHYADVTVRDSSGRERAKWDDPDGQQSMDAVDRLVASMQWTTPETLQFFPASGEKVVLSIMR